MATHGDPLLIKKAIIANDGFIVTDSGNPVISVADGAPTIVAPIAPTMLGQGLVQETDGSLSHGIEIYNETVGTLAAGTLVYLSSYTGTSGVKVVKADADANIPATHVVKDAILPSTTGLVYERALVTDLNTNGRTIGDAVYLDSTTAGGYTYSAPSGPDQVVQQVGAVKVVSATVGEIEFWPSIADVKKIGSSYFQPSSVDAGAVGFTIATHGADNTGSSGASATSSDGASATSSDGAVATASGTASISVGGNADSGTASISVGGNADSGTASISVGGNADSDGAVATASGTASIGVGGNADSGTASISMGGDTASAGANLTIQLTDYIPLVWGKDVDNVWTNGGGLVGTVPVLDNQGMNLAKVCDYNGGAPQYKSLYTSSTMGGGGIYTSDFQLFPDAEEINDYVAFGGLKKFVEIGIDMSATVGVYSNNACVWEYSQGGGAWATLIGVFDNTDATAQDGLRPFQRDGALLFPPPADWAEDTLDGQNAFWIRSRVTAANITTAGLTNSVEHDIITGEDVLVPPASGDITKITLVNANTTRHSANNVKVILYDSSNGDSRVINWTINKRRHIEDVTDFAVTTSSQLSWFVYSEDGTNEPTDVIALLTFSSSTSGHTHGATGLTATDAGHTHNLTSATATDAGHTHTGGAHTHALTSATATDAGHTHNLTSATATDAGHTHNLTSATATDAGHTHTGGAHTHTAPAHTHTAPAHTHSTPSLAHSVS